MSDMEAVSNNAGGADKVRKEREPVVRKLARPPIAAQWAQDQTLLKEIAEEMSRTPLFDVRDFVDSGILVLNRKGAAADLHRSFKTSCKLLLGRLEDHVHSDELQNFRELLLDQDLWLSIPSAEKAKLHKNGKDEMILPTVLERYRPPGGPILDVQKMRPLFPAVPKAGNLIQTKYWEDAQVAQLMKGFEIIYEFQQLPIIIDAFGPGEDVQRRAFRETLESEDVEACAVYESNALRIAKVSGVFAGVENLYMAMGRLPEYKERSEEAFKELDYKIAEVRRFWKTEEKTVQEKIDYLNDLQLYVLRVWNEAYAAFTDTTVRKASQAAA